MPCTCCTIEVTFVAANQVLLPNDLKRKKETDNNPTLPKVAKFEHPSHHLRQSR